MHYMIFFLTLLKCDESQVKVDEPLAASITAWSWNEHDDSYSPAITAEKGLENVSEASYSSQTLTARSCDCGEVSHVLRFRGQTRRLDKKLRWKGPVCILGVMVRSEVCLISAYQNNTSHLKWLDYQHHHFKAQFQHFFTMSTLLTLT